MEIACDTQPVSPAKAANVFATRPNEFRTIHAVDIFGDCVHLYNDDDQGFSIRIIDLDLRRSEAVGAVVKILSAAGFGGVTDAAGHSLISIIRLNCCGRGIEGLSISRHEDNFLVAYH